MNFIHILFKFYIIYILHIHFHRTTYSHVQRDLFKTDLYKMHNVKHD